MKRLFKSVHLYYFQGLLVLLFISLYPVIFIYSKSPVKFHGMNRMRYLFSYLSALFSGFIYRYSFEQKIDWSRNYIICANHTSNLDITAIILLARRNYVFMGKEELLKNFVTGIYFRTVDIPVNRESKISAFRAFKKAEENLKEGKSVVIFPEGMISDTYPPVLQLFKNGPFRLAIEQGIPILPITIGNNWSLMWDDGKRYGSSPGICDICVHAPIETLGMNNADAEELKNRVYDIISTQLNSFAGNKSALGQVEN